jgi:hypothetical protein
MKSYFIIYCTGKSWKIIMKQTNNKTEGLIVNPVKLRSQHLTSQKWVFFTRNKYQIIHFWDMRNQYFFPHILPKMSPWNCRVTLFIYFIFLFINFIFCIFQVNLLYREILEDYNEANKQQNRRFNCEPSKLKTKIIVFFTISLFKGTTV